MFVYQRKAGTADVSVVIRIIDVTDGTPETGVVYNTAGIDLQYRREGAANVSITEADLATPALDDAHSDGGFLHIGNGYYRLDLPDAACAAGATGVLVHGTVTGMVVIGCYVQLVAWDPFDGVRGGLTALPNATADGAGGLPISDAGGLDLDTLLGRLDAAITSRLAATAAPANFGDLAITATTGRVTVDTNLDKTGYGLSSAADGSIADAVWDEILGDHTGAGSAGQRLGRAPNADAGASGGLPTVDASNRIAGIQGSKTTLDSLNDLDGASVNAEVADVLKTDTIAELAADPGATPTFEEALMLLYMALRNAAETTASQRRIKNNAGSTVLTASLSDSSGTFTKGKFS